LTQTVLKSKRGIISKYVAVYSEKKERKKKRKKEERKKKERKKLQKSLS
jgi:hypothetical protein